MKDEKNEGDFKREKLIVILKVQFQFPSGVLTPKEGFSEYGGAERGRRKRRRRKTAAVARPTVGPPSRFFSPKKVQVKKSSVKCGGVVWFLIYKEV